jgi:hypothetical protein
VTDEKDPKDETESSEKKAEAVTAPDKKEVEKAAAKSEKKPDEKKSEAKKPDEKKPKTEKKKKDKELSDGYRVSPSNPVAAAWKSFAAMGLVGVVGSAVAYSQNPARLGFSWLFGFVCALTVAIGAMMFVMMHHLASAHWGVVVRRVAEVLGASSWVLVLLFVPVYVLRTDVFNQWMKTDEHAAKPHAALEVPQDPPDVRLAANDLEQRGAPHGGGMRFHPRQLPGSRAPGGVHGGVHGGAPIHIHLGSEAEQRAEHVEHEEVMSSKSWFLNQPFFVLRMLAYFGIWSLLGLFLLRWSLDQDKSKDPLITVKLRKLSAPGVILLSLTLTLASFDWIMALEPTWYSTIFGVTFFSSSMVCIFALLILTFLGMRESGVLVKEVTVEHYHDLGKLLFGFMCFWAYVCFSQFMLIWYATLPEEVTFYHHRWDVGIWRNVSLAIVVLHFMFPFVFIMSRNIKRNLGMLKWGAVLLLTMHVIDMYWLVLPNAPHQTTFSISWIDVVGFMGPVGIFLAVAFKRLLAYPIIPVGDPRLQRSIHFLNA